MIVNSNIQVELLASCRDWSIEFDGPTVGKDTRAKSKLLYLNKLAGEYFVFIKILVVPLLWPGTVVSCPYWYLLYVNTLR